MITFCVLVAPLPYTIRKRLFKFLSESFIIAKIAYGLKISFMLVSLRLVPLTHFLTILQHKVSSLFYSQMPFNACSASQQSLTWPGQGKDQSPRVPAPRPTSLHESSSMFHILFSYTQQLIIISSSQRNTYLTGFCLFLSLVLTRTFYIMLDLIHTQEEYAKLKKSVSLPPSPILPFLLLTHIHSPPPNRTPPPIPRRK